MSSSVQGCVKGEAGDIAHRVGVLPVLPENQGSTPTHLVQRYFSSREAIVLFWPPWRTEIRADIHPYILKSVAW